MTREKTVKAASWLLLCYTWHGSRDLLVSLLPSAEGFKHLLAEARYQLESRCVVAVLACRKVPFQTSSLVFPRDFKSQSYVHIFHS